MKLNSKEDLDLEVRIEEEENQGLLRRTKSTEVEKIKSKVMKEKVIV